MPERSLAIGAAGGSFASLLLGLAKEFAFSAGSLDSAGIHSVAADCICGALDLEFSDRQGFQIFILGVTVGVLLGPLVDLIWILRQRWRRFILVQSAPTGSHSRTLYKVI